MHFFSPSHWLRPQWSLHRFVDFYSDELIHLCRESYEVRTDLTFDRPQMTFRPQIDLLALKWTFKAEVNIHNLHVWTLTGNKVVGTVHIKLINETDQAVQIEKFNKVKIIYSCCDIANNSRWLANITKFLDCWSYEANISQLWNSLSYHSAWVFQRSRKILKYDSPWPLNSDFKIINNNLI